MTKYLHPEIMGIVNVTPDSFSDGGLFFDPKAAVCRATQLLEEGATWVDIGAESTRPGSQQINAEQEWLRLAQVLNELPQDLRSHISLDTRHELTVHKAYDLGIRFFNNVDGLYSEKVMSFLAKDQRVFYCAMHMNGRPRTMQENPLTAGPCLEDVQSFFSRCSDYLSKLGFKHSQIYLDPGIGFGKDDQANLTLIQHAYKFSDCYNLLYGISRKSFIGRLFDIAPPAERDAISKVYELALIQQGVKIIRTHNVGLLKDVLGRLDGGTI